MVVYDVKAMGEMPKEDEYGGSGYGAGAVSIYKR